jgi:hypothetical protein
MSLLTKPEGSAFDSTSLGVWFAEAIEEAGLPKACVMHGLRNTAARRLAAVRVRLHRWPRQRFTD